MARPAAFNRDRALQAAMQLFWARGYAAASLPDLLAAMGIARSSFYSSFGDKESLYLECLDLFARRTVDMLQEGLAADDPGGSVRRFFERTVLNVPTRRCQQGCMMVNTVLEAAEVEPSLQHRASDWLEKVRNTFEQLFEKAHANGALHNEQTPGQLADLVMTINLGLRVQSRRVQSPEQLRPLIDNSLAAIGLAA